jgi:hypothetical protein
MAKILKERSGGKKPTKSTAPGASSPNLPQEGGAEKAGSVTTGSGSCCEGLGNGLTYCFDGAVHVLVPPSSGGPWIPFYTPGVGWDYYNASGLITDTHGEGVGKPTNGKKPPGKGKGK